MNYNFNYVGQNKKNYAFSRASIGDRVWSILHGWGTVNDIDRYGNSEDKTQLHIVFDIGGYCWYKLDGRCNANDLNPELYWEEAEIVPHWEEAESVPHWEEVEIVPPEKPDTLIDFLKRNFDCIGNEEFGIGYNLFYEELGEDNEPRWELLFSHDNEKTIGSLVLLIAPTADGTYLEIEERLNLAKVTYEQMFDALKELGWI